MEQASGSRHCPKCGQWRPARDFYAPRPRNRMNDCRMCERTRMKARYQPWREYVNAIKLARGCIDCGYRAHVEALEFDHLPGVEKFGEIAKLVQRCVPFEVIDAEIAKCELVCANCHRVRTTTRRDVGKKIAYNDLRRRGIQIAAEQRALIEQLPLDDGLA